MFDSPDVCQMQHMPMVITRNLHGMRRLLYHLMILMSGSTGSTGSPGPPRKAQGTIKDVSTVTSVSLFISTPFSRGLVSSTILLIEHLCYSYFLASSWGRNGEIVSVPHLCLTY